MEPISAFAFALNVLQVVEISLKVASTCKEIYENGSLAKHDEIADHARELASANSLLEDQLKAAKLSPRDSKVRKLAEESRDTANDLAAILRGLNVVKGQSRGRALLQTFKSLVKRHEIESLQKKLEKKDELLNSIILKELYTKVSLHNAQQTASFEKLNSSLQRLVQNYMSMSMSNHGSHQPVNLLLQGIDPDRTMTQATDKLGLDRQRTIAALQGMLESLSYPERLTRQNMIQQRVGDYRGTYRWLFEDAGYNDPWEPCGSFHHWLQKGGTFWWTGKPGSGKSSLMNYIYHEFQEGGLGERFTPSIGPPWVFGHFFYRPGSTDLQVSLEGLLRNLCYQILTHGSYLLLDQQDVFEMPRCLRERLTAPLSIRAMWLQSDLKSLFEYLVKILEANGSPLMLVDGLDEVSRDQEQIVSYIFHIRSTFPKLRICCSSRSDPLFRDWFEGCLSARLQDFTSRDLRHFCDEKLSNTRAAFLCEQVVSKAEGVFLWLSLVANELRHASRFDDQEQLQDRLNSCPSDMFELFDRNLSKAAPQRGQRPNLLLACFFAWSQAGEGLPIDTLALLLVSTLTTELHDETCWEIDPFLLNTLLSRIETANAQIAVYCAGLVEPLTADPHTRSVSGEVPRSMVLASETEWAFIHRSVADFLTEKLEARAIEGMEPKDIAYAGMRLVRARLAALKILKSQGYFTSLIDGSRDSQRFLLHKTLIVVHRTIAYQIHEGTYRQQFFDLLDDLYAMVLDCLDTSADPHETCSIILTQSECLEWALAHVPASRQIYCHAARHPSLWPYLEEKLVAAPATDRSSLAALALVEWMGALELRPHDNIKLEHEHEFLSGIRQYIEPTTSSMIMATPCSYGFPDHMIRYAEMSFQDFLLGWMIEWVPFTGAGKLAHVAHRAISLLQDNGFPDEARTSHVIGLPRFQFSETWTHYSLGICSKLEILTVEPNETCTLRDYVLVEVQYHFSSITRFLQYTISGSSGNVDYGLQMSVTKFSPCGAEAFLAATIDDQAQFSVLIDLLADRVAKCHINSPDREHTFESSSRDKNEATVLDISKQFLEKHTEEIAQEEREAIIHHWISSFRTTPPWSDDGDG